jgi:hypothetical protein
MSSFRDGPIELKEEVSEEEEAGSQGEGVTINAPSVAHSRISTQSRSAKNILGYEPIDITIL